MTETNFPLAPTFADSMLAPPPVLEEGLSTEEHLQTLKKYLDGQYVSLNKMQNSIASGWLVSTLRVLNLTADTIVADSVFTQDLWIGKDDSTNGYIGLLGTSTQIKIVDENGTTRVLMGDLGAGATNWGVQFMNTAGTVIFEAADQVFIDGAVITDATIVNAKIVNSTIDGSTKLANSSVPNSKISSMSADKITVAGTLTCTSSTTAINVTSSGVVNFSAGGDIRMRAAVSGDTNFLTYQTSGGSDRGYITYSVSGNIMYFLGNNADATFGASNGDVDVIGTRVDVTSTAGAAIHLDPSGNVALDASGTVITVNNHFRPTTDSTLNCGTSSIRWANGWFDLVNGADICFDNGWRLTEPDKVYKGEEPNSGLLIMNDNWECVGRFDRAGNLWIKGFVKPLYAFLPPDIPRRESKEKETDYAEK